MEQLLECMDKLKGIQSLVVESIKKMQVICKSLRLARYEQGTPTKEDGGQYATKERNLAINKQEKLTKENDGQCKLEDKKAMGAPQNQIIPPSRYSSMQQLLNQVKDGFATPNSFPSLQIPGHNILLSPRSDPFKPLRTRADFKGGGMLHA